MDNLTPITREEMLMNDEPLTPITREEKILAGEDLTPVTRREYFLKKYRHAGGDVMVEGLEVTANGTYTAPEGKAYSPVEVAVPLPDNAYLLKTASGSLVSFSDGADLPMPSFVCNIDAVQDLHGYDAPWVGGAGKNKAQDPKTGVYGATTGEWSGGDAYAHSIAKVNPNTTYTMSVGYAGIVSVLLYYNDDPSSTPQNYFISSESVGAVSTYTFTTPSTAQYVIYETGGNSTPRTKDNVGFIQIELGSTATAFESYENICPISGHTGVNAVISPTTEASAGTTYSVSWQTEAGEVFGGYVDLVSGVLTVTWVSVTYDGSSDEMWTKGNWINEGGSRFLITTNPGSSDNSTNVITNYLQTKDAQDYCVIRLLTQNRLDIYTYNTMASSVDEWRTYLASNNLQVCYELATPITYQLTPTQIKSLLGNNNAWCDTGDVDIDYFAKEVTG